MRQVHRLLRSMLRTAGRQQLDALSRAHAQVSEQVVMVEVVDEQQQTCTWSAHSALFRVLDALAVVAV